MKIDFIIAGSDESFMNGFKIVFKPLASCNSAETVREFRRVILAGHILTTLAREPAPITSKLASGIRWPKAVEAGRRK
jgi:hypothetical protein